MTHPVLSPVPTIVSVPLVRRLRPWGPVFAWCALIFVLSSVPGKRLPEMPAANFDKVVHAIVYGVLGALCWRALRRTSSSIRAWIAVVVAALLATAYGVSDELHQLLTPGRSSDVNDVIADAIGGLLGALLAAVTASLSAARSRRRS